MGSEIDWIRTTLARAGFAVPSSLAAMIERGHQDQAPVYFLREDQSVDDSRYIRKHFSAFQMIPIARRGDYDGVICVVTHDGRVPRGGVVILHFDGRPGSEVDAEYPSIEAWADATAEEIRYFVSAGVYDPGLGPVS